MAAIDVAAALVFRAGKLLITRRHAEAHLGGLWEFPGGKREPGESFEECLRRELDEELKMKVHIHECIASVTHAYPEKTVRIEFFRCSWECGEPQPLGCAALTWVAPEELNDYEFPAADAQLLEKLRTEPEIWE